MAGKVLDANILIDLFRRDEKTVEHIKTISRVYVPAIVLGELYYGACMSDKMKRRMSEVERLATKVITLDITRETTALYGEIRAKLKRNGKKIPENDIWIAALCIQHDLPLVTNDIHFDEVENLITEKP